MKRKDVNVDILFFLFLSILLDIVVLSKYDNMGKAGSDSELIPECRKTMVASNR